MAIDTAREQTTYPEQTTHSAICDCGCAGSGCSCGCACCGAAEHETAVEVLAQAPQTACDCGCCG